MPSFSCFFCRARNCVGQKFAQNEEKVLVAKIVKNFKITATESDPKMMAELILRPIDGIKIKVTKRE